MSSQPVLVTEEWEIIIELLESERSSLPAEIHHADRAEIRETLRQRMELLDGLITKIRQNTAKA